MEEEGREGKRREVEGSGRKRREEREDEGR
jgi:hypothetical protein